MEKILQHWVSQLTSSHAYSRHWDGFDCVLGLYDEWGMLNSCTIYFLDAALTHLFTIYHGEKICFLPFYRGQSFFPWCNEINPNKTACLTYANAYGTCGLDKWPMRLPKRYQYFQSIPGVPDDQVAYYGGGDPLVDFCPYWTVSTAQKCAKRSRYY